jgi:UDP-N-acetylglucosamine--N-acetylmuramyl-(pentapeptide) pyrophosphoryl-undecaprenol N-acetylglucosamine transferase
MVEPTGIPFVSIPAARWRRFFSLKNLLAPFILVAGFLKSYRIIRKFQPDVMFAAGSYVSVPLAWVCRIRDVKIVVHQQDARIGLANKMIAPVADQITTAFEKTSKEFYSGSGLVEKKLNPGALWVGNPVRPDLFNSSADAKRFFNLHDNFPILLILGGATGALQINQLIEQILPDLVKAHQVVHQTGKDKKINFSDRNYHAYELIPFPEYAAILKLAHLVVARSGLSTIAELSALAKPAIIIPMPYTHQEDNARILEEAHAAVVLNRDEVTAENLARVINSLKFNQKRTEMLSKNISELVPKNAAETLAKIVIKQTHEE